MDNSFESLYEQYLPKIYRYMYNRTLHKQTSEDLTSTVFMKAISNWSTFKNGEATSGAWLYTIARNTLIDYFRKNKPTFELDAAGEVASLENIESLTDVTLKLEATMKALSTLSDQQREVLILRVWDDLSHLEIAEILNISEASSKMTLSRALDALKGTVSLGEII